MTEETTAQTANDAPAESAPGKGVVNSIRGYVATEDGAAKAVLQPAGSAGVRITLVGEKDGVLGDRVVPSLDDAREVVAAVDGLETAEWDRELTTAATTGPKHWRKMAGWVANSSRFPKPRNRKVVDYR
ncbi:MULTISPECIES: hypothetical protein [unclassified Gordonia (in: high G+C Gram-positive bacteria)]|uniref:hypothetical protein n=1 Tax=unclassified Gordonia (in: high G+C Gram-positive bacteria) TaxID=2657482 RepID=UPI001FFEE622|nr:MULTISPECIES: hypothetical protein [unclassified Gordonia (in: high G+C Gram-positive bacteria)]UQE76898.1 hypothetical protein MYK68_10225 [Gordonia sp. PP30]